MAELLAENGNRYDFREGFLRTKDGRKFKIRKGSYMSLAKSVGFYNELEKLTEKNSNGIPVGEIEALIDRYSEEYTGAEDGIAACTYISGKNVFLRKSDKIPKISLETERALDDMDLGTKPE
ncbi:MAG: hypothetical protein ABIH37_03045 [archaeon]